MHGMITAEMSRLYLVPHEKYVSNMIGQNCNIMQLHNGINELNVKVNMINSHFHYVHNATLYKLFKIYCMTRYVSQLWDTEFNKFCVSWRKAIRKLFDLPYITHCDLLPYICDNCPPNEQLYFRVISLCKSLANTENNIRRICYAHAFNGSGSAVSNTISVISSRWAEPRKDICICNITRNSQPSIPNDNPDNVIRADLLLIKYIYKFACTGCRLTGMVLRG